jgi:endoglucanase
VNYGNVLDADPPEGWGRRALAADFTVMARGGFRSVRIPVRWSAKTAATAPYEIDPAFARKVDGVVDAALAAGLHVILDLHNYDEIHRDPEAQRERFLAIWAQIAARYRRYPRALLFEILNEPHGKLTPEIWNAYLAEALAVIRRTNPDRVVLIGPAGHGNVESIGSLSPPRGDRNLIVSFHYYAPFEFTHQGAAWVGPRSGDWLGRRWTGTTLDVARMSRDFRRAGDFARLYGLPVNVGEYGAYSKADMESRVRWTAAVSRLADELGYSRHYWEFKAGFGLYDEATGSWREPLRRAVVR